MPGPAGTGSHKPWQRHIVVKCFKTIWHITLGRQFSKHFIHSHAMFSQAGAMVTPGSHIGEPYTTRPENRDRSSFEGKPPREAYLFQDKTCRLACSRNSAYKATIPSWSAHLEAINAAKDSMPNNRGQRNMGCEYHMIHTGRENLTTTNVHWIKNTW